MVMIQSLTAATTIFITTLFISSLVTNSAFAQAQSMNQSMNNAGDSANQAAQMQANLLIKLAKTFNKEPIKLAKQFKEMLVR